MEYRPKGRFSARDRVRKRAEFERIREAGRRVVTASFVFLMQRAEGAAPPRLGITASRRVGNAVERNRAKRLVREAFRVTRDSWPRGAVVVVIVRHALGKRGLGDVVAEWQSARSRLERCFAQLSPEPRAQTKTNRRDAQAAIANSERVPLATNPLPAKKSC